MQNKIVMFFRKSRDGANYSIERSFKETIAAFPIKIQESLLRYEMSYYSNGVIPRLRMMNEARQVQGVVNHITGDINFMSLALPGNKTMLTVLDCGFMRHPNPVVRWILSWLWLKLPVRHCKIITAISEATKQEIIKFTKCPGEKIRVVPILITSDMHQCPKVFNIQKPRILHIGSAPNKNLIRHIKALKGINCTLHIVGKLNAEVLAVLEDSELEYENSFDISDEEVRHAYESCDLLLFASTLEGFGMPILEAQTVGRPVITSNLSSMPEVAGVAACLVDPWSIDSIRAGVIRLIEDGEYRQFLIEAGFENVKRFQATTIANMYSDLYEELING